MKKILSLVLVLSLVLGTFSFAFAATPEDVVGEDYQEEVETLMALGVINGYPDGTFKPERTVTRAEMAKLLVGALGYGELAEGATSTFADVQGTWAESYVGFAASMDLVVGYPDGTFRPSQPMTMDEAMTMVIRALGYTDEVLKGSWPTNYKVKALDLGLTDNVTSLSGAAARSNVAVLLFNALDARTVEVIKDANGLFTYEYEQNNDGTDKKLIDKLGKKVPEVEIAIADVYGDDALDTVIDMTPYVFHTITYYENNDRDIAYVSDVHTDEFVGTVVSNEDGVLEVENADDDDTFDITTNTALFYNGDEAGDTKATDLLADKAEVVVVYDDDDVKGIVAWEPLVKQATQEYSTRRPTQLRVTQEYWDLPENDDEELDLDALTVEGDAESLEDIEEDDVIYYYAADGTTKVKLVVVRDTFTGKFTKRVSATEGTFGGESLDVSVFSDVDLTDYDLATTYDLTLDKDGDIFAIAKSDEEPTVEGYAVFVDVADGTIETDEWDEEDTVDKAPRVKLFTDGGDVVIYSLDFDLDDPADVGEIELSVSGSAIIAETDIEPGTVVEIELNDDGAVIDITTADISDSAGEYDEADMLIEEYDVTDATVIFNIYEDDEDDWTVIEASDLIDGDSYDYVVGDDFHADVIVVDDELVEAAANYAVITDYAEAIDEDDDVVYELTVLTASGEETYLTTFTTEDTTIDEDDLNKVVTLDMESGKIDDFEVPSEEKTVTISAISGRRIDPETGSIFTLDEDVVVFIQDGDDFEVGTVSDLLKGDEITVYGADNEAVLLDLAQYDAQ